MAVPTRAAVVMARCAHHGAPFGIRVEEAAAGVLVATWAFAVRGRGGSADSGLRVIEGAFRIHPDYPGCPGCEARAFFRCSCGGVGCWDAVARMVRCPWCADHIRLEGEMQSARTFEDV